MLNNNNHHNTTDLLHHASLEASHDRSPEGSQSQRSASGGENLPSFLLPFLFPASERLAADRGTIEPMGAAGRNVIEPLSVRWKLGYVLPTHHNVHIGPQTGEAHETIEFGLLLQHPKGGRLV
ncbi:hypothetical protein LMH87_004833 [Akanthomyces muscarius]|uniref:Uncharacterized protein n=1 Tax=Akanthomyces muscarius TaxID=2231603 RepID=A0A9W8Q410_AKAMU|nr:hypothetical protein LMH87_004833 [Akanthomyces muscarius]KAJ4146003.1 hypothetical protein LMH87_004833 [Akanthomyces muscarius]